MMSHKVVRVLAAYSKATEEHVAEWVLPERVDLAALQKLFGASRDDAMYGCWPVTASQKREVESWIGRTLDLGHFDYFVEAHAVA